MEFIGGLRFDAIAISYIFAPFIIVYVFSFGKLKVLSKWLFGIGIGISLTLSSIDLEYFKFTNKRTTFDLFTTEGIGQDLWQLLPQFLSDFWFSILLFILSIVLALRLYKKTPQISTNWFSWPRYCIFIISILIIAVIGSRGGIQLRPLGMISASLYAEAQNIPLVLNTPFTVLKSSYKEDLELQSYYPDDELKSYFSPRINIQQVGDPINANVALIILESFGQEYIGTYNPSSHFTPFLDSLITESLHFPNAYANGKKSIEALPAILSGLPNLMNTAYISSKYSGNRLESISSTLKKRGYKSGFYHGATNGTMGFNSFAKIAQIDHYYGLNEYPEADHYDGNWGIFDEPYFQYFADQLNSSEPPWFNILFSLSSHHPYTIPEKYQGQLPKGELDILESVAYTDLALKQFFKSINQFDWFENTIFIITADHTSSSLEEKFSSRAGIYKIPIILYGPKWIKAGTSMKVVSQSDIYPTVLDILNISTKTYCFGESMLKSGDGFALNFLNNEYQFIKESYSLLYNGESVTGFFNLRLDPEMKRNLTDKKSEKEMEMLAELKAIIQTYNRDLIQNKTHHE